ncbi:Holliday junction branch migration protein RuvA [Clostridium ganghwense]|uniref:Holliday junction branch migration complex subunit RuvA n=1 Tax=Clostridium ganghwense TaxID=312089 RepID=A0ABT4CPU8_9CLOT|nr:Holliday junction branch migration protein RuvA [Clostridium ganghwense]MCY6370468.1 Holliday junction branch migration protein RuvA [Clostridium ganghwense]
MYEYIKGTYIGINKDYIIVENNNIGHKIYTSGSTMAKMPNINEEVKIFIQQIVREDFIGLYGFLTEEEREMFNLLLTINGVGSKAALSLLSISNVNNLKFAILSSDYATLTKAPGIGKKIAQRIILELKDKLGDINELSNKDEKDLIAISESVQKNYADALEALISLGFSEKESEKALKLVDINKSLEVIIKDSLKHLMN